MKTHRLWFISHNFGWKKLNTFPQLIIWAPLLMGRRVRDVWRRSHPAPQVSDPSFRRWSWNSTNCSGTKPLSLGSLEKIDADMAQLTCTQLSLNFNNGFQSCKIELFMLRLGKKILAQASWDSLHLFISTCVLIKSCNVFLHFPHRMDCSPPAEQIFCVLFSLVSQYVSQARFALHISNLALKTELLISCRLFLWCILLQRLSSSQILSGYFLATSVR